MSNLSNQSDSPQSPDNERDHEQRRGLKREASQSPENDSPSRKAPRIKSPSREAARNKSPSREAARNKYPSREAARNESPSREAARNESPSREAARNEFSSGENDVEWILLRLCLFILDMSSKLRLEMRVSITGCIYLRRMFSGADISPVNYSKPWLHVIASSCLFLATKMEDKPTKLDDIIRCHINVCNGRVSDGNGRCEDPEVIKDMYSFKAVEEAILKLLEFDLNVDHPHARVLQHCQAFGVNTAFMKKAYLWIRVMLVLSNMYVQHDSAVITAVAINLTSNEFKTERLPSGWRSQIKPDLTPEEVEDLSRQLRRLITRHWPHCGQLF